LDNKNPAFDQLFGTAAVASRWAAAQDKLLESISLVMGALLLVAQVQRTKFDASEPFLLFVHFAKVLASGYSVQVFQEESSAARFAPS
jgi:hypothetical protein